MTKKGPYLFTTNPHFRDGTKTDERDYLFWLKDGALGDYICWMSAILYVAKNYDYIRGQLICPHWFSPLAKNFLKPYPKWTVHDDKVPKQFEDGYPMKMATPHPVNATMMHLVDLGFLHFVGINPVPEGAEFYPEIDLDGIEMPTELNHVSRFAVMTPGSTWDTRKMESSAFNAITKHLLKNNIIPVHVGASSMNNGKREINIDSKYDLSNGINLIDKTDLLTAAKVLSKAEMVIGIDNGLLHLAATTSVTILFGYTMVGPKHRRPHRLNGKLYELYPDKEKLPCTFCQENVRFFLDHDFKNCIYGDIKCTKALNAESWVATIDLALKEATPI